MRWIFSLSSHLQASNRGVIVRIGLDRHNIALMKSYRITKGATLWASFQIGRARRQYHARWLSLAGKIPVVNLERLRAVAWRL